MYTIFLSTSNLCSYLLFIIDEYLSALKLTCLWGTGCVCDDIPFTVMYEYSIIMH